ncbi:MAG: sensory transduction histidine kinase [Bacteroidetes bacterium]|nr:sensory transduction histidine kinase [Bacteroidota bacterium]
MAETYHILLIEKDKQVADDVRRFLRASAGDVGFAVDYQKDLVHGHGTIALTKPDAVVLDAAFVDADWGFSQLRTTLTERRIPLLVLSANNGDGLDKQQVAGAADYLLKNKLNYFYLPKAIVSAIKSYAASDTHVGVEGVLTSSSHRSLLDRMTEAVLVINTEGEVVYANRSGRHLIADTEVIALLKRFINFREGQKEIKATVEIQSCSYDLKVIPQDWSGEPSICIHLSKNPVSSSLSLQDKISLLNDLIQTCSLPFVLLVNDRINTANDSFLQLIKADRTAIKGDLLENFISSDRGESVNLFAPARPDMVKSIKGANLTAPLELLRKTVTSGEDTLTVCSLASPGQDVNQLLSPHRLMEIASHDLREPVRTSVSYLQLLTEGLKKGTDNKKLLSYAETITDEIGRAERMLADMKLLMNLRDRVVRLTKVNMMNQIQDVLKQLKPVIDASDAMVNVSEMPSVRADSDDVRKLLYHLIDNALKFQKKDKRPYVEILAKRDGKFWQFCIKDNGIGIDAKYHEAIFEPFRKLNRVDEYTGAGNGLCICKNIVEANQGRIWVESHEGFGSSFFFTLPAE